MSDTHQVSYKYLIKYNGICKPRKNPGEISDLQLLKTYYEDANKAADVWAEVFLNICGGITPGNLKNARYSTASVREEEEQEKGKTTKKNKKKTDIKKFNVGKEFPDGVLLFFHWFTVEDGPGTDPEIVIKPQDIFPRFKSYCAQHNVTPLPERWEEVLRKTAYAIDPVRPRTWVDRVQAHKKFINHTGISRSAVEAIFDDPYFPFQQKKTDSIQYCVNLLSSIWGSKEKTGWDQEATVLKKILEELPNMQDNDAEMRKHIREMLKIPPELNQGKQVSKFITGQGEKKCKSGRIAAIYLFVAGESKIDTRDELKKVVNTQLGRVDRTNSFLAARWNNNKQPQEFKTADGEYKSLFEYIVKSLDLPYHQRYYVEFFSKALERLLPVRKNSLNTAVARYEIDTSCPEISEQMEQFVTKWLNDHEQPYLSKRDIGGLYYAKKICNLHGVKSVADVKIGDKYCTPSDLISAVALAEKESTNRRANFAFLKELAKFPCDNWFDCIEKYQIYTENCYKFESTWTHVFTRFSTNPNHPSFGDSRPGWSMSTPKTEQSPSTFRNKKTVGRSLEEIPSVSLTIDILTKNGVKSIPVGGWNKRAFFNIHAQSDDPLKATKVPRRTPLLAKMYGQSLNQLESIAIKKGMKLIWEDHKFYATVTFEVPYKEKYKKIPDLKPLNRNWRFIGVDPGIRESMTVSVGEIIGVSPEENRNAYVDKEGKICVKIVPGKYVKIIEVDGLRETDFQNTTGRYIDRMHSTASRKTNNEVLFWDKLKKQEIVEEDCPDLYTTFAFRCAKAILGHTRKNIDQNALDLIAEFTEFSRNCGSNTGHNTYRRINTLKTMKSLYQSAISRLSKDGKEIPNWLKESLDYTIDKVYNLRNERKRRINNLLAQKCVQYNAEDRKVVGVFIENTGLDVHSTASKKMMRDIDNWTPRQIVKECPSQINPLGISVIKLGSQYTSHIDIATPPDQNVMYARYDDITGAEIKKMVSSIKKLKNNLSDIERVYIDATQNELAKLGTNMEECNVVDDKVYRFPKKQGGKLFKTTIVPTTPCELIDEHGFIDEDKNAAIYFLVKGLRYVANYEQKGVKSVELV